MADRQGEDDHWKLYEYDQNFLDPNDNTEMRRTSDEVKTAEFANINHNVFGEVGKTLPATGDFEEAGYGSDLQPFGYGNPFVPAPTTDFLNYEDPLEKSGARESEKREFGSSHPETLPPPSPIPLAHYEMIETGGAPDLYTQSGNAYNNFLGRAHEYMDFDIASGTYIPGHNSFGEHPNKNQQAKINEVHLTHSHPSKMQRSRKIKQEKFTGIRTTPTPVRETSSEAHISYHDIPPRQKIRKARKPTTPRPVAPNGNQVQGETSSEAHISYEIPPRQETKEPEERTTQVANPIAIQLGAAFHTLYDPRFPPPAGLFSQQDPAAILMQTTFVAYQPQAEYIVPKIDHASTKSWNKRNRRKKPTANADQPSAANIVAKIASEPAETQKEQNPRRICSVCKHTSKTYRANFLHRKTHFNEEENVKCIFCDQFIQNEGRIYWHSGRGPYPCRYKCGETFACAGLKRMHGCKNFFNQNFKN